jgi:hypothetical protein
MPKAIFVKKAQKPNSVVSQEDIDRANNPKKPGDETAASYWHWSMKTAYSSVKRKSKTRPRASEMTLSDFWGQVYGLQEDMEDATADFDSIEDIKQDAANRIREIGEECREKFDNMPEGLQQGSSGELLEQRAESCESAADEIECLDSPDENDFDNPEEFTEGSDEYNEALEEWKQERADEILSEIQSALSNVEG